MASHPYSELQTSARVSGFEEPATEQKPTDDSWSSAHEDRVHGTVSFPFSLYTNGDPSTPDFRRNIDPHWHDEAEFIYVAEGRTEVSVGYTSFSADPGTVIFVQPALLHSVYPTGKRFVYYAAVFDLELVSGGIEDVFRNKYLPLLYSRAEPSALVIPPHSGRFDENGASVANGMERQGRRPYREHPAQQMLQLIDLYRGAPFGFELGVKSTTLSLLHAFIRNGAFGECPDIHRRSTIERVEPCLEFIRHNYRDAIHIDDIACAGNMSKYHLCHLFKEVTGKSPLEYLTFYRIHRAMHMLRSTTKPVIEVALEVGFNDPSYFARVFRRYVKQAPSEYRTEMGS